MKLKIKHTFARWPNTIVKFHLHFDYQGAVPKGNATKEMIQQLGFKEGQVFFKCPKCCSIKPERAHHCSVCQRCIRKMDHHCPWYGWLNVNLIKMIFVYKLNSCYCFFVFILGLITVLARITKSISSFLQ